jgi:glycine amidinotransferase/scyllo-inosamine-4-phosphate amidinotransferase 1
VTQLKYFFENITQEFNLEFISAPLPELPMNPVLPFFRNNSGELIELEEKASLKLGSVEEVVWHRLEESEILFDAANVVRHSGGAIYLVSSTGNKKGKEWLTNAANDTPIESTDVYRSSHLDSTILPLNEETFLVNSIRVNSTNIPNALSGKKILFFDEVSPIPNDEIEFHLQIRKPIANKLASLGFDSNLNEMSSPWAGMNVLSIDPTTVLVESNQANLIKFLELNGFDVIPIRFRHPYTMLGGLHCTTLDLERNT